MEIIVLASAVPDCQFALSLVHDEHLAFDYLRGLNVSLGIASEFSLPPSRVQTLSA